jgi:L-cysteine/cystine lyase
MRSRTVVPQLALTGAAGALLLPAAPAAAAVSAPLPAGGGDAVAPLLRVAKAPLVRRDVHAARTLARIQGRRLRRSYRATISAWPAARIHRHTETLHRKLRRARRAAQRSTASPALQAIAVCESGGDPRTDTGNGFYGKYQFTLSTWQALGGTGNPAQAPESEQDRRAATLLSRAGAGQWPACARQAHPVCKGGGMDVARLRSAFPVLEHTAYLNAGTCGPVAAAAQRAAVEAWRLAAEEGRTGVFYERVIALSAQLRERYGRLLGAPAADVALTSGTSDGCGRVIAGLELGPGDEIVTADDEHPGLQGPLVAAREQRGVTIRAVAPADVPDAVTPATKLVACSHVSWHSGALAPVAALAEIARGGVPVLLDGAQGIGALGVDVGALGATFYAGSGQKWLCGPVGSGMLWIDPSWRPRVATHAPAHMNLDEPARGLESALAGDARRFDVASQDLSIIAAAVCAFDVLDEAGFPAVHERAAALAATLAERLAEAGLPVVERGPSTLVAWSVADDDEAVALRDRLAAQGVVVRNLPGAARLRASVGAWNDEDDLQRLLAALA